MIRMSVESTESDLQVSLLEIRSVERCPTAKSTRIEPVPIITALLHISHGVCAKRPYFHFRSVT